MPTRTSQGSYGGQNGGHQQAVKGSTAVTDEPAA